MNNWKLRSTITGTSADDLVEVNGYLQLSYTSDVSMAFVPFGDKFAAGLRTSASDNFGPVSNQVPGICNGTFTHTTSANGQVSSTTLTGEGSGATFFYSFIADGTLSSITAATAGSGYKVGDKLQITTNQGHVIQFRLVDGSNAVIRYAVATHDAGGPSFPFPVHRVRINNSEERTVHILDYRSSQVFPKPQDKLLDKYPATVAFGMRKLRSAYQGYCVNVRRNSDNALLDIGFDSQGNLDTKALLDFAGDKTVTVRLWYDQSGNIKNAGASSSALQPTIVDAGTLVTVNGKPALKFNGSTNEMTLNTSLLKNQDRLDAYMHYQTDDNLYIMFSDGLDGGRYSFDPVDGDTGTNLSGQYDIDGTEPTLYVNGVESPLVYGTDTRDDLHTFMVTNGASHSNGAIVVHEAAGTQGWTNFGIGNYTGGFAFAGKLTEMVLYNTDQSANREGIEKDMALHSGAYQVEDAPLLDAYGGAHAAYSLRKLNSDYTGAAARVVAVTGNAPYPEQDIGFDSDGNFDVAALEAFSQGNANIKTLYDQSGNGNDITQVAVDKMPKIMYSNGNVVTVSDIPAMRFDGSSDAFPFDNTGLDIGNLSSFMVMKANATTGLQFPLVVSAGDPTRFYPPVISGGNFTYTYGSSTAVGTSTANTNNNLHTMIAGATQGDAEAFLNGSSVGTKALGSGLGSFSDGIGGVNGANFLNGFIQEIVVYSSDQSERREGIERNISNHYDL